MSFKPVELKLSEKMTLKKYSVLKSDSDLVAVDNPYKKTEKSIQRVCFFQWKELQ